MGTEPKCQDCGHLQICHSSFAGCKQPKGSATGLPTTCPCIRTFQ
jgi:hypothetical protein